MIIFLPFSIFYHKFAGNWISRLLINLNIIIFGDNLIILPDIGWFEGEWRTMRQWPNLMPTIVHLRHHSPPILPFAEFHWHLLGWMKGPHKGTCKIPRIVHVKTNLKIG